MNNGKGGGTAGRTQLRHGLSALAVVVHHRPGPANPPLLKAHTTHTNNTHRHPQQPPQPCPKHHSATSPAATLGVSRVASEAQRRRVVAVSIKTHLSTADVRPYLHHSLEKRHDNKSPNFRVRFHLNVFEGNPNQAHLDVFSTSLCGPWSVRVVAAFLSSVQRLLSVTHCQLLFFLLSFEGLLPLFRTPPQWPAPPPAHTAWPISSLCVVLCVVCCVVL